MTGKKKLYESIQVLEAKLAQQNRMIMGITTFDTKSSLNPIIMSNASYNAVLNIADKIQCVSRYITDIPELELPSNKLEALFYDFGALCFTRVEGRAIVSMFAKSGDLNGLGDLKEVIPIDFAGKSYDTKRTVVYTKDVVSNPCVIIEDYTGTFRESNVYPRAIVNSVSINDQSEVYRQLKNSIKLTAKKAVALIESEGARDAAERNLQNLIDNDNPIISIIGDGVYEQMKLFNLDTALDMEGYLKAIETYERIRANFNGVKTRGHTDKKERLITSEVENDDALTNIYLYDGYVNRQIGIELMKKHSIIKEGSVKLNPLLDYEKEEREQKEMQEKQLEAQKQWNANSGYNRQNFSNGSK